MIIKDLQKKGLVSPPKWLADNTAFLGVTGSTAYKMKTETSDEDIVGFCFPEKELVFPHLAGEIPGFGRQLQRFNVWQQHHIQDEQFGKEYDFSVYSIVAFFQLAMEGNPNICEILFLPPRCIKHSTYVAEMVRDNRKLFLHKGMYHKFKGYAYSSLSKVRNKNLTKFIGLCRENGIDTNITLEEAVDRTLPCVDNQPDSVMVQLIAMLKEARKVGGWGSRKALIEAHGFDTKFASHCIRLLDEIDQVLALGDLELGRNCEQLKSIRRGEWSLERIETYFEESEKKLELLYAESKIPHSPNEEAIKQLLLDCLEHHYGSISSAIVRDISGANLVRDIEAVLDRYRNA